jgi:predicted ATPase
MLREMTGALVAMAEQTPIVLVLENLQWADHATLNLLAHLAAEDDGTRLLILGTYRQPEQEDCRHAILRLQSSPGCTLVALAPLSEASMSVPSAGRNF